MANDQVKDLIAKTAAMDLERQRALRSLSKDLERVYENFWARALKAIGAGVNANLEIAKAATILEQLNRQLIEAGLDDIQKKYGDSLSALTKTAVDYFGVFAISGRDAIAGLSPRVLDAYVRFKEREIGNFIRADLVPRVEKLLMDGLFGGLSRTQIYDSVAQVADNLSTNQVEVMVEDAFAGYQRTVQAEVADNLGMEIFIYIGPADQITSEQCTAMLNVNLHGVPGMLYKNEITVNLHPKLRRDPLIGGGHPRCRHHWSPITTDYAVELGFEVRNG